LVSLPELTNAQRLNSTKLVGAQDNQFIFDSVAKSESSQGFRFRKKIEFVRVLEKPNKGYKIDKKHD